MNITLTLVGQTLTFFVFVWFCAKFVWPQLISVMQAREQEIENGLKAAEQAKKDVRLAEQKAGEQMLQAKEEAAQIIDQANKRAAQIIDQAKEQAKEDSDRLKTAAHAEIEQEISRARESLRGQLSNLVLVGAEKILEKSVDVTAHNDLVNNLAKEL